MKTEQISVKGFVTFHIRDSEDRLVRVVDETNLVTTAGKNYFVKKIIEDPSIVGSAIASIAVGSGSTAPTVTDASLESETGRVDIAAINDNLNIGEFTASIPLGTATGTIQEAGLYTNDSSPILISRIVLTDPITKASDETIQVSWRFKIGSG